MTSIRFLYAMMIASLLGLIGCGGDSAASPEVARERAIKQIGEVYRNSSRDAQKPPQSLADFKRYAQMAPAGYQAINDGSAIVFWDVALNDLSDAPSADSADEVLAYEKQVPTAGGMVLLKNRSVRTMTADQFQAAPKAGKTSSDTSGTGKSH